MTRILTLPDMKFIFLIGGLSGFLVAAFSSWWSDHTPDRVFLDGALGCLAGAILFRWFWRVLLSGVREAAVARQQTDLPPDGDSPPSRR